ncbi:hypothetical protein K7432_010316 [Basidiobolus ranarum]|uniref:3'-5' exonuclease n=1 Tax=Basidiobolus ranarum TaxID=34480 RepID=A0ABR2VVN8_9FUNG
MLLRDPFFVRGFQLKVNTLLFHWSKRQVGVYPNHTNALSCPQVRLIGGRSAKKGLEVNKKQKLKEVAASEVATSWGLANLLRRKKSPSTKKIDLPSKEALSRKMPQRKVLNAYAPKPIPQRRERHTCDGSNELTPTYYKELKKLPVYLVKNEKHLQEAMKLLMLTFNTNRQIKPFVGFDTEHPLRGKVAIIQFANDQIALVIQVRPIMQKTGNVFPKILKDFLENKKILKVGVNSTGDSVSLHRSYGVRCNGIRNIEELARVEGLERQRLGLKRLSIECSIGMGVLKGTNARKLWGATTLLNSEILYAVKDALASYRIFSRLVNSSDNKSRIL